MRGILFVFLILIMVGICYAQDLIVERPTYSAGDYWIFIHEDGKEVKIEFLREEKNHYVFNKNGTELIKDFNLTSIEKKGLYGFPGPVIKFPLKVGEWWNYEYEKETDITKRSRRMIARYEVTAYEQITVHAGTFWTLKIDVTKEDPGRMGRKTKFKGSATYWYAPDVKQIIKSIEKEKASELKEYKIK